jgi:hypothetical protein
MLKQKKFVVYYGPHNQWSGNKIVILDELSHNIETLEIDESVKIIIKRIQ